MAEIFGTVAAALSVAALFNNCVDCFEYIQLGRNFGRDYQRCQLRLDVARNRLTRWGEAVSINVDPRFATATPSDDFLLARDILEGVGDLFQAAIKKARRYENKVGPEDRAICRPQDLPPVYSGQHVRLLELAQKRQKSTNIFKKAAWALYDGKDFERMIDQITGFIDELEKLFPVEAAACRRLAEIEIEEVDDELSLAALKDAADGTDVALLEAVVQKGMTVAGRNFAKDVNVDGDADVQVGDQINRAVLVRGVAVTVKSDNSAETVQATGTARVQIGGRYGV